MRNIDYNQEAEKIIDHPFRIADALSALDENPELRVQVIHMRRELMQILAEGVPSIGSQVDAIEEPEESIDASDPPNPTICHDWEEALKSEVGMLILDLVHLGILEEIPDQETTLRHICALDLERISTRASVETILSNDRLQVPFGVIRFEVLNELVQYVANRYCFRQGITKTSDRSFIEIRVRELLEIPDSDYPEEKEK